MQTKTTNWHRYRIAFTSVIIWFFWAVQPDGITVPMGEYRDKRICEMLQRNLSRTTVMGRHVAPCMDDPWLKAQIYALATVK